MISQTTHIIGRAREQHLLETLYNSQQSEFVAIYGRRRVGKTFLIRQTLGERLTFEVSGLAQGKKSDQIKNFYKTLCLTDDSMRSEPCPTDWIDMFDLLIRFLRKTATERKVIFIDEMPWMDTPGSGFMMALEHFWNGWASARNDIVLIVCGSATSWMMNKLINNHGGLHNRLTERIFLHPFTLYETEQMLTSEGFNLSHYEICICYMVFGGIPYYINLLHPSLSLAQNIDTLLFDPDGKLHNEFNNLYASLFKHSTDYVKVVKCLSEHKSGLTRQEIVSYTKLSSGSGLTKILQDLESCGFIRNCRNFAYSKRESFYQLIDLYSLFYFRFLADKPTQKGQWTLIQISESFYNWAGLSFELLCLLHINQMKQSMGIAGVMTNESTWRCEAKDGQPGAQIDLIIDRNDNTINLCEMKFTEGYYVNDKDDDLKERQRIQTFRINTATHKSIIPVLVTTEGLMPNTHSSTYPIVITLNDLFTQSK